MTPVWVLLLAADFTATACHHGIQPDWMPELIRMHIDRIAARLPGLLVIFGGALVLHVVGLIDDVRPLAVGLEFAARFPPKRAANFSSRGHSNQLHAQMIVSQSAQTNWNWHNRTYGSFVWQN